MTFIPSSFGMSTEGNTSGNSGMVSNRIMFVGGNNITLSQATNSLRSATLTISSPNMFKAGVSTGGNSVGTSGTVSNQLIFAGGDNITLSQSTAAGGNTITISGATAVGAYSAGISNIGNTSGTSGTVASQVVFAGGNNVTLSQSVNGASATITVSAAGGGGAVSNAIQSVSSATNSGTNTSRWAADDHVHAGVFAAGVSNLSNDSGNTAVLPGRLVLAGGNNITLSQSSSNNNNMTVTISGAAGGGGGTLSSYEPYPIHNTGTAILSANTNTSGSATFIPFNVIEPVAARHINLLVSMNMTTGGTSSFQQSRTMSWGIYTRDSGANSTRMSALTSNSLSYAMTYNNSSITVSQATTTNDTGYAYSTTASAGLNISSQYTGLKRMQLLILTTLVPRDYYLGLFDRASSSSFNSGVLQSYYGNAISISGIAPMGSLSSAYSTGTNLVEGVGGPWLRNAGVFTSAGQTNLPNSLAISAMTNNLSVLPYMSFATTA